MDEYILADRVARPGTPPDQPPILIPSTVQVRSGRRTTVPSNYDFPNANLLWITRQISRNLASDYITNQCFYDGDHWQRGKAWIGPVPDSDQMGADDVIKAIYKSFVSENTIKEIVDRKQQAAIGREPAWSFTPRRTLRQDEQPNAEEAALIQELNDAITQWWDDRNVHELFSTCVTHAFLSGKGPMRMFIPSGFLGENGEIPDGIETLTDALNLVYADAVAPDEATVIVRKDTTERAGVYAYLDDNRKRVGEICFTRGIGKDAITVLRTFLAGDKGAQRSIISGTDDSVIDGNDTQMELGGRITIGELVLDKLITQQIRQLQMLINLNATMAAENTKVAGFLERVILNGQMPGHIEPDPAAPNDRSRDRWVSDDYQVGAGTVNYIAGNILYDQQGNIKGIANPEMKYREPVDVTAFVGTRTLAYASILGQAQQLHYLLASEQYASGESRKQARADFESSLRRARGSINIFGRWFMETLVALGAWLLDDPGRYDSIRCVFDARVDPGPATTETIRAAIELWDDELLSREGAQTMAGMDDPDAESARIAEERARGIQPPQKTQAMGSGTGGIAQKNASGGEDRSA